MKRRRLISHRREEMIVKSLMIGSFILVIASLGMILVAVIIKGLPTMSIAMLTQTPRGGFYLGGEGGILNAIIGSLYLAGGGTLLALMVSLPLSLSLQAYADHSRWTEYIRLVLDVLWGVPSIAYGAFGFMIMMAIHMRSSLLGGMVVLALLELPIMTRTIDEVVRRMPPQLEQASFALGATRLETAVHVAIRQIIPGLMTGILLAFGRGIGDAASVMFTAGFTDRIPDSLLRPAASLPLAVFFQLNSPYPQVQHRAYTAALVLTILVTVISLSSRWLSRRLSKYVVK